MLKPVVLDHPQPGTVNSYLVGNFAPVTVETTAFDLPVTGTIPRELDGRLLRIGPVSNEMARNMIAEGLGLPRSF